MKINSRKKGAMALSQVMILVVATFAFAWMVGSSFGFVSADAGGSSSGDESCVAAGGACSASLSQRSGASCSVGSRAGTVKENLCSGKYENKRCCIPNKEEGKGGDLLVKAGGTVGLLASTKTLFGSGKIFSSTAGSTSSTLSVPKSSFSKFSKLSSSKISAPKGPTSGFGSGKIGSGLGSGSSGTVTTTSTGISWGATVAWVAVAFLAGRYVVGPLFGLNVQQSQSLGYALAAGTAVGLTLVNTGVAASFATVISTGAGAGGAGGPIGIAIGVVVAAIVFAATAKKSSVDIITYSCYAWDADYGGENCELCNKGDLPCTEYQCRSLGQGCELTNTEFVGEELCIWANKDDIDYPIIEPWDKVLLEDYDHNPDNAVSPPDRGVFVDYVGDRDTSSGEQGTNCVPVYEPFSFGVSLNEPAKCKMSPIRYESYDEMPDFFFSGGVKKYNHSSTVSLPSAGSLEAENITLEAGQSYELYVRCKDANGNTNPADFVIKFCANEGPDTTAPLISASSPADEEPFASGQKEMPVYLYVNEPAECKWSHLDKSYESMENNLTCSSGATQVSANLFYQCSGALDGLLDDQVNNFYFRCKDQPGLKGTSREEDRNANAESYKLRLIGTRPLVIDSAGPDGKTLLDATTPIKVTLEAKTSQGYDKGNAICKFSTSGEEGSYVDFFYEYGSELYSHHEHAQDLWLPEGDYNYYIRCHDRGGNTDERNISFSIDADVTEPVVVRAFNDGGSEGQLRIITDEPAKCVYDTLSCNYQYDNGIQLQTFKVGYDVDHYTDWDNTKDFYVKCEDGFGNRPLPNVCSIIARPFEIFEVQDQ